MSIIKEEQPMKTTDRVLSFLLALVMVFSLFSPGLAYAEEPEEEGTIAPVEDPAPVPDDPAAPVGDGVLDVPTDDSDSTGSIAPAAETETVELASGSCGTNLTWRLTDDGVLTISGTGAMTTYSSSNAAPWNSYKNSITSLVVESGVTTIGAYAFYGCNQLVSATLPDSVTTLSSAAFRNCTKLTNVNLPSNLGNWGLGDNVFNGCSSLAQIIIPSNVKYIQSYAFLNCSSLASVGVPDGADASRLCEHDQHLSLCRLQCADRDRDPGRRGRGARHCLPKLRQPCPRELWLGHKIHQRLCLQGLHFPGGAALPGEHLLSWRQRL